MIAYTLNKNISGEKLLNDINNLVEKYRKNNPDCDLVLRIDIIKISHDNNSLIPKLEYEKL